MSGNNDGKFPADGSILVIGMGNAYRSDDGVGLAAARLIEERALPGVKVLKETGEGGVLIDLWQDAAAVIIVDTVQLDAEPGSIHRFEADSRRVPADYFHYSTHLFGVAEAIELARVLGKLPRRLIVYGINAKNLDTGTGLSPEVAKAVPKVVERAVQDIIAFRTAKQVH
ncbi:MAG: hydrogenase maturation protease [Bacillota bacterium]